MEPFFLITGLILVFFGRNLFWLFIGVVGFLLGIETANVILAGYPQWLVVIAASVAGILGVVAALFFQRVAFAIAGFYACAYLTFIAIHPLVTANIAIFLSFIGGIIGVVLSCFMLEWLLIVLSCLIGAGMVVGAVGGDHMFLNAVFYFLLVITGITFQKKGRRRDRLPSKKNNRGS